MIDFVDEGLKNHYSLFKEYDNGLRKSQNIVRPLAILACMLGLYFLFAPIIQAIDWIPLVESLLNLAMGLAAAVFAFVVGVTLEFLVLGAVWVFYKPLIGVSLLVVSFVGFCLIFI